MNDIVEIRNEIEAIKREALDLLLNPENTADIAVRFRSACMRLGLAMLEAPSEPRRAPRPTVVPTNGGAPPAEGDAEKEALIGELNVLKDKHGMGLLRGMGIMRLSTRMTVEKLKGARDAYLAKFPPAVDPLPPEAGASA